MKYGSLAVAFALGCVAFPVAAQTLAAGTKWVNERGSELTITSIDTATGALTGSYFTMAPFPCKEIPHPVAGYVAADRIVFSVNWRSAKIDCQAATALSGILENGAIAMDWETIFFNPQQSKSVRGKGSDVYSPRK
jgi:Avidin family